MHYHGVRGMEQLVDRYLTAGDERAIEQVIRLTRPRLLRIAARIVGPSEAEDCVQTALLSLTRKRGTALHAKVWPWLVTAVVRIAYRRRAERARHEEIAHRLAVASESQAPLGAAIAAEEQALLRNEVGRLPDAYRDVVVLHYLQGLPTPEVAQLLGIAEVNVRKRLERARRALRSALGPTVALLLLGVSDGLAATGGIVVKTKVSLAVAALLVLILVGDGLVVSRPQRENDGGLRRPGLPAPAVDDPIDAAGADGAREPLVQAGPRLAGVVLDAQGAPIADARVVATAEGAPELRDPSLLESRADAGGRFSVPLPGETHAWLLYVEAPGYASRREQGVRPDAEVTVVLRRPGAFAGRVMDLGRRPVAGARVRWFSSLGGVRSEAEVRSGSDGGYRIEVPTVDSLDLSPAENSGSAALFVDASGFAHEAVGCKTLPEEGKIIEQNIVLARGATLKGRVLDAFTGAPVRDAVVELRSLPIHRPGPVLATGAADEAGTFTIENVPCLGFHVHQSNTGVAPNMPGAVVVARAKGYAPSSAPVTLVRDGGTATVEVSARPAVAIEGSVIDVAARPIADARIAWTGGEGRADANGHFRLGGLPAGGRERLTAEDPETGDLTQVLVEVPREGGRVSDILFRRTEGQVVLVNVVDESGRPLAGATVRPAARGAVAWTGADGRVRVVLPPGARNAGVVSLSGFAPAPWTGEDRVVLVRGREVRGRVEWADGVPVDSAVVTAFAGSVPAEVVRDWRARERFPDLPPLQDYGAAFVDSQGRFVLTHMPPGPYLLAARVAAALNIRAETIREAVPDQPGDVLLVLDVSSTAVPRTILDGRVRDAETGEPVPIFSVTLSRPPLFLPFRLVEPGRFRFEHLPGGRCSLQVEADGYVPHRRSDLDIDGSRDLVHLDIELERGARVYGTVRAEAGLDVRGLQIALVTAGECSVRTVLSAAGTYEASPVPPGNHRIVLSGPPARNDFPIVAVKDHVRVTVAPKQREVPFDFVVVRAGLLTVRLDGEGAPAPFRLRAIDGEGRTAMDARNMGIARVFSRPLPPGAYTVQFESGRVTEESKVEVRVGETTEAKFAAP